MVNKNWFVILCVALSCGSTEAFNMSLRDDNLDLAKATGFLVQRQLSKLSSTVVIAESSFFPNTAVVNRFLLSHLLINIKESMTVQLYIGSFNNQLWDYYILFVDSAEAFRNLRFGFPVSFYERNFFFLVILTKYTPNFYNIMQKIFQICYQFNVINVSVILHHPSLGVCIYTYTLFSDTDCRVVQPQLYIIYNQESDRVKAIFPKKLVNFHGCPMRMTSRIVPPMITFVGNVSNPKSVDSWFNLGGVEGFMIKVLADTLNFTIDLLPFRTEHSHINDTKAYGCFADIVKRRADFAIGSFSGSDPNRWIISPSVIYYSSPYVLVIRGKRAARSLARLATPFHWSIWFCLGIFLASGNIIIQIVRTMRPAIRRFVFGPGNDAPSLNFFGVFLGYPATRMHTRNFARYLLIMWFSFSLIIRNAYQGSLYDTVRLDKFAERPTGFDNLMKWNYKIIASKNVVKLGIFPRDVTPVVMSGSPNERYKFVETSKERYAVVTLRDNFLDYMRKAHKNGSNLIMINEVFYMQPVVMYFPKHSIYLPVFDRVLNDMAYSGISKFIKDWYIVKSGRFGKQKDQPSPRPISIMRLEGVYEIYVVTTSLALMVFGLELVSIYFQKLRRIIKRIY